MSNAIDQFFIISLVFIQIAACYASYLIPSLQLMPIYMFWLPTIILLFIAAIVLFYTVMGMYAIYRQTRFENFKKLHE